ncbi:hypothetical protein TrVE_jg5159 [Triparma verrucosa]|uniref:Transmembrane protein n=1 Tax=Triparma verrucosa TaxID=1606542 RepID=A0A9W7B5F3_9STRA|nr:hypothetical protein TrVE_jg5159 [Triparma verrucosa]
MMLSPSITVLMVLNLLFLTTTAFTPHASLHKTHQSLRHHAGPRQLSRPSFVSSRSLSSPLRPSLALLAGDSPEELLAAAQKLREAAAEMEGKTAEEAAAETVSKSVVAKSSGDLYDDEVDEPDPRQGLSDTMRDRLLREAQGLGADPNSKQENYIVWVAVVVGVLVVAGGKGILY